MRMLYEYKGGFRACGSTGVLIALSLLAVLTWAQSTGYQILRIVMPEAEEVVHDNDGAVTVVIQLSPALRSIEGHRLKVLLDDRVVSEGSQQTFALTAIERGTHSVQAQVTAADGSVLITSAPTTFHMWRASRLFPKH